MLRKLCKGLLVVRCDRCQRLELLAPEGHRREHRYDGGTANDAVVVVTMMLK